MAAELALDTTPPPGGALYPCGWCVKGTRVRTWSVCVSALCLAGLLAACSTKDPIDWAIDPGVTGEQREILRAALKVVIAECPALAGVDWEDEVTREREDWTDGHFSPTVLEESDPSSVFARPMIDGWTRHGEFYLKPPGGDAVLPVSIGFSWTEPPGIATEVWGDPLKDVKEKNMQL